MKDKLSVRSGRNRLDKTSAPAAGCFDETNDVLVFNHVTIGYALLERPCPNRRVGVDSEWAGVFYGLPGGFTSVNCIINISFGCGAGYPHLLWRGIDIGFRQDYRISRDLGNFIFPG